MSPLLLSLPFFFLSLSSASDPDPIRDFCIARPGSGSCFSPCKPPSAATADDFTFSGVKSAGNIAGSAANFTSTPVNADVFPALNTLGVSFVRADFGVGGINPPHFHPRATEVAFVLEGTVYSGFVDTENRVYAKVISKGEVMVFPKGMIHFQMNVGDGNAAILGNFDSQNPGLMKIPSAIFGSEIKVELLEKVFGLNAKELAKLKKKLSPH